jgi:hypothetical protein
METTSTRRIQPAPETLDAARRWLEAPRAALGPEFLAAYLSGSVLTDGFDPKRSNVNVLVVARSLDGGVLDSLAASLRGRTARGPVIEPMFLTRRQIEKSLDVFPIEWLELKERHLLLEGEDVLSGLDVPRTYLRLQCEHELRGRHIRLRQAYLVAPHGAEELGEVLRAGASSFDTLFRTLLRLQGEDPPADAGRVVERIAERFALDAQGLLGAHVFRYSGKRHASGEVVEIYRAFLAQIERLVHAIDALPA